MARSCGSRGWRHELINSTISYAVDGKQYVVVYTGRGQSVTAGPLRVAADTMPPSGTHKTESSCSRYPSFLFPRERSLRMSDLKLSIATTDYDHFRDFRLGAVKAEGIDHNWLDLGHHECFATLHGEP